MPRKDRNTLKQYFKAGSLPSEDQFENLIDSSLNTIDEGFDRTPENGFEISLISDHHRLISFFRSNAHKDAVWTINYDKDKGYLYFQCPDNNNTPPVLVMDSNGRIGVNEVDPSYALDINGVIAHHGRIGANPDNKLTVPADGKWHDIIGPLNGCNAFEVMAGVGNKGTGKYALMNAIALNTFNPKGVLFNFLNLKKKIKYHHAYYSSRINRMKLRWRDNNQGYFLQIKTYCDYGEDVNIRFYITQLWFDEIMSESCEGNCEG